MSGVLPTIDKYLNEMRFLARNCLICEGVSNVPTYHPVSTSLITQCLLHWYPSSTHRNRRLAHCNINPCCHLNSYINPASDLNLHPNIHTYLYPPTSCRDPDDLLQVEVESTSQLKGAAEDIEDVISKILKRLEVDVVGPRGQCEAHLTVIVTLEGLSDEYKDADTGEWITCFTGQSAHGEIVFDPSAGEVLTFPVDKDMEPVQGAITACPRTEEDIHFVMAWGDDLLLALKELWGYRILVSTILKGFVGGHPYLSYEAGDALEAAGPKAVSAVYDLINMLSMVHADPALSGVVSQALEAITGQDFGNDPEAWRTWWEDQQ
jgi:hypothetical protein